MKRFFHIDFLRAVAILAVIAIHVFSDNLTSPLNAFIWNYLHVIIVAFVFCSGYVMYGVYAPKIVGIASTLVWYKKRLIRLLLPFYYYLAIHLSLMLLFPHFFSGLGLQFNLKFILQSVTLVGGINLNWLPLLFLQLAILFPLLLLLFKKKRILFWIYISAAVLITMGFTLWQFPYSHYRAVMWIPWSLFLVLPWYFYQREEKKNSPIPYLLLSAASAIGFCILFVIWSHVGRSLTLIDNKYPPNFFYITYECFGSFLMLALSYISFFRIPTVARLYTWISKESYALFFIHYIVMDFFLSLNQTYHLHLSVWYQLLGVLGVSMASAWLLHKTYTFITNLKKTAKIG